MRERVVATIGQRIRGLRQEKQWTLQRLAEASGVSPAAISKLENNGLTPTITTLMKIADALGRKISYFIEEDETDLDVSFIPREGRERIFTFKEGIRLDRIAARKYGDFMMAAAFATAEPGADSGNEPMVHRGEELVYSLEGEVEFTIQEKHYLLRPGDAIHFKTRVPHSWRNPGTTEARLIWVLAIPPS